MVVPSCFDMYDDDLLDPECELRKIIELHRSCHVELREACPHREEQLSNRRNTCRRLLSEDTNTPGPVDDVVEQ